MKILVLNGSPKKEKSDTMHLTRAFLRGMQEAAPQEVQIICNGCNSRVAFLTVQPAAGNQIVVHM